MMAKTAAKKRVSDPIDVTGGIAHLRHAICEMEMVRAAGPNNGTRQNVANAKAHITAVFGILQLLEGRAFRER